MAKATNPGNTNRARPRRRPSLLGILVAALTIVVWTVALALVGLVVGYQVLNQGRIMPGVFVRGIDLSGATPSQARQTLQVAFEPYPLTPIIARYGDRTWRLTAEDLGVDFDPQQAAELAYQVGRHTTPDGDNTGLAGLLGRTVELQGNLQEQLAAFRFGHEVLALETIDRSAGLNWLQARALEIDRPVVEAQLLVEGLNVVATPSQVGHALDVAASHQAIYEALLANQGGTVDLAVHENQPLLDDVSQAEVFVRQVLAGPITLVAAQPDLDTGAPPPSYTVAPEQLAPFLSLDLAAQMDGSMELMAGLDLQPLRRQVLSWAADLAREPRDGKVAYDPKTGELSVVEPSQLGRSLDVDATMAALRQATFNPTRQAELPLRLVEPAVNTLRTDEMGIVELIAEASTSFKGSGEDRVHNIATGAAAVDNTVVPPGAVFSFNDTIGDVDAEHGYRDSLIIWGDRTAIGIGGGICQVSTTAFRAAYLGGFPIEERWNHGYVVGWYGEPGLDATIYTPNVDFKFRNTTDHHLIIKTEVNEARGTLTFRFYGTKPDWQVTVTGPETISEEDAPPPIYQEDDSLVLGQIRQVEYAKKGVDVEWRRVITNAAGDVLADEVLESSYTPWPAYYLVGPGTQLPAGIQVRPQPEGTGSGG